MNLNSHSWPSVDGEVIHSDLADAWQEVPPLARITYSFVVGGKVYESSQIAFYREYISPLHELERVYQYRVGRKVQVYYDPTSPANAIIERSRTPDFWLPLVFGANVVVISALIP